MENIVFSHSSDNNSNIFYYYYYYYKTNKTTTPKQKQTTTVFLHCKILSGQTILSAYMHTLHYTQFTANLNRLAAEDDGSTEQKAQRVCCLGKSAVLRLLLLKES